jgi:hypothetical protein
MCIYSLILLFYYFFFRQTNYVQKSLFNYSVLHLVSPLRVAFRLLYSLLCSISKWRDEVNKSNILRIEDLCKSEIDKNNEPAEKEENVEISAVQPIKITEVEMEKGKKKGDKKGDKKKDLPKSQTKEEKKGKIQKTSVASRSSPDNEVDENISSSEIKEPSELENLNIDVNVDDLKKTDQIRKRKTSYKDDIYNLDENKHTPFASNSFSSSLSPTASSTQFPSSSPFIRERLLVLIKLGEVLSETLQLSFMWVNFPEKMKGFYFENVFMFLLC